MIQLPAILTRVGTRSDRGASLSFVTNEITDEELLTLFKMKDNFGYVMFKENSFQEVDIPTENAEDTSQTISKRMRAVLFLKWKKDGSKGDWETYYRNNGEKIITHIKSLLD